MNPSVSTDFKAIETFLEGIHSVPTHWPEWNTIISKYYQTRFFYWVETIENQITGICPVHEARNGMLSNLYSGQFHYIPYGGWLRKENLPAQQVHFPLRFNQQISLYSIPRSKEATSTTATGYTREFLTLHINLDQEESRIWEECVDSKRRNMIRKALKSDMKVEEVTEQRFNRFFTFYEDANQRYGLESLSRECLSELLFSTSMVRFKATYVEMEGQIISSHVLVHDKDYALYWLGLNSPKMPNNGQGELLQWEAIVRAKKAGCRTYDLCYIEKERLPKIYEFKKGFSEQEVPIHYIQQKPLSFRLMKRLLRLKRQ